MEANFRILRHPLGVLKIIQFLTTMIAFSCVVGFGGYLTLTAQCYPPTPPINPTTKIPIVPTTKIPIVSTTKIPIVSTTKIPIVSTTKIPIVSTTKIPIVSTTKIPIVSTTKIPNPKTTTGNGFQNVIVASVAPITPSPVIASGSYKASFQFPFRLSSITVLGNGCDGNPVAFHLSGNYAPATEFFVAVGVLCFVLTIPHILFYLFFWDRYEILYIFPNMDLLVQLLLSLFWLAGTVAFVTVETSLKSVFSSSSMTAAHQTLCPYSCTVDYINWAPLDVAAVFGFINFLLYFINIIFVFRMTKFVENL